MADKSFGLKQINMIGVGTPTVESSTNLVVNTNGSERLRINSSGYVGIGTNNPGYKLDVRPTPSDPTSGSPPAGAFVQIRGDDATVGYGPSLVLSNFGGTKETAWRISAVSTSGNNGDLVFNGYAGGATYPEVARFTSAGNLKFPSGQGIDFSATSDASGRTSELLDDYEEGTWDPGYSFGGTAHTSIVSAGTYIKTGGMVFVTGYLYTNNSSTYSGTATITGLPFSIPSGMRYRGAFAIGQIRRFNEDMPNIKLYHGDNGSVISMFRQSTNSNGVTELTNAQFNFQSEFNILSFSGSYPVA